MVIHEFNGSMSIMIVHMLSGAPLPIHVQSVGLNLGGNKVDEEGFSVQGKVGCWRKACFSSAAVRKDACRDVGRLQNAAGRGGYTRCLRVLWTGSGRGLTALRGRFLVAPSVPFRMRAGGAQLSGRILESGADHCLQVCGGLSHP